MRAFSKISSSLPGARLAIAGDGAPAELEKYKRLAGALNISGKVIFTGLVTGQNLPSLYNAADVFLMPSKLLEAGPYTLLEAMACGRTIIAAKRAGSVEILGKNGFYHAPGDPEELSGLMKKLHADPAAGSKHAGENIERLLTIFSRKASLDRLESFLSGLTAADGKRP